MARHGEFRAWSARPVSRRAFAACRVLACLAWLTPNVSSAAEEGLVGKWAGPGEGTVTANVRADPARPGHFVAEIETKSGACMGGVEVSGRLGDLAVATAKPPYESEAVCRIELRLLGPDRLRVTEVDNCIIFHGAACGFTGELTRRGAVAPTVSPRTAERPAPPAGGRGGHVPWAPDCEFLHLDSAYAPVGVTGTVSPEGTDCYAIKPNAGMDVTIEVAKGRNVVFSISDIVDAVDSYHFRANGYGHKVVVGQLMRSATRESYRLIFSSGATRPLTKPASAATAGSVAYVQRLLNEAGFDAGPVDGKMGSKTKHAIRQYQSHHGLKITGEPDPDLMRSLQSKNGMADSTSGNVSSAKDLDVPVIELGGDGQAANCFSSIVLAPKDNEGDLLAVRSGPGSQYRKIDKLHKGEIVIVFEVRGEWAGIVYRASNVSCHSRETHPLTYKNKGWIHTKYLKGYAG